jgi:hypothetical protein
MGSLLDPHLLVRRRWIGVRLGLPCLPLTWPLLSLEAWVPSCRGPRSANIGRNASEQRMGHLEAWVPSLSWQPNPVHVTSNGEGDGDAFLRVGEREVGSTFLRNAQQVPESSVAVARVSSFSLGESSPFSKKVHTKGVYHHLLRYVHVECSVPSLQPTTSFA